jgi:hypothetical protein
LTAGKIYVIILELLALHHVLIFYERSINITDQAISPFSGLVGWGRIAAADDVSGYLWDSCSTYALFFIHTENDYAVP